MSSKNCKICSCGSGHLSTVHHCADSFPQCIEYNPCSEIISNMCVIHTPNGIFMTTQQGNITIPENITMYSYLQLMAIFHHPIFSAFALDTNTYRPILDFRTLFIGTNNFKLYWAFPNVPDPNTMTTNFRLTVFDVAANTNVNYIIPSNTNVFTVYDTGGITYQPNTLYRAYVALVNPNSIPPNQILTVSAMINIRTKQ